VHSDRSPGPEPQRTNAAVTSNLVWSAQPGILPADCDIMIITADPSDSGIAIAKLQRLIFVKRHGGGDAYFGISYACSQ